MNRAFLTNFLVFFAKIWYNAAHVWVESSPGRGWLLPPPPTGPSWVAGFHPPFLMKLYNKQHQKARAFKMLEAKIMQGKTHDEIAQNFGVAKSTVAKAMSLAKKGDLLISFEDKLHNELLPLAHDALVGALTEGNAKVALEIFKGTNILKKTPVVTKTQQQDADDLAAYIFAKRTQTLLEETSIDITPEPPALPAAATSPDASGDPAPDGPSESAETPAEIGRQSGTSIYGVDKDTDPPDPERVH